MALAYPKREKYFAHRFIRLMHKTCLAQSIGLDSVMLLTFVVLQEDVCRYKKPVTFYNDQLLPILGFAKWIRLKRARQAAVDAGWLQYESGGAGHRKPGLYFVSIPEDFADIDDTPISQVNIPQRDNETAPNNIPEHIPERDSEHEKRIPLRDKVGDTLGDTVRDKVGDTVRDNNHTYSLSLPPIPIPKDICPAAPDGSLFSEGDSEPVPERRSGENGDEIRQVFDHYRKHHPKSHPKPLSTSKEWRAIRSRLNEGYTVADLCEAIDGCHVCPHNCGINDRNTVYQDLNLIVRDGGQVARFIEEWKNRGRPVLSEKNLKNVRAAEQFKAIQRAKHAN